MNYLAPVLCSLGALAFSVWVAVEVYAAFIWALKSLLTGGAL